MGAVRDFVSVAVSTLSGDRLDVSRRLRARRDSDASCGRAARTDNGPADRPLHADALTRQSAPDNAGPVWPNLSLRRDRFGIAISIQQHSRSAFAVAARSKKTITGLGHLSAIAFCVDGS